MTTTSSQPTDQVRVEPTTNPVGIVLIDDIQGVRVPLTTTEPVLPVPGTPTDFCFPVDVAYELETTALRIPTPVNVCVRDQAGTVVVDVPSHASETLDPAQYTVEIGALGIKTYLVVDGGLQIPSTATNGQTITVTDTEQVSLGVRSVHNQPAATITTTTDPTDAMRALSCFGASLKTTTCERSFPSLRGHPPRLELGECFEAPGSLERTPEDTPIHLEIPPTFEYLYPAASLAYYLNAAVVPSDSPQLIVDGTTHAIEHDKGYDAAVGQLLKHVFTLDCLIRTEGFYPVQLTEREQIENVVELDFAALYKQPLAEQVKTYLSVPFDTVAPVVPRWPLTTTITPTAAHLEALPYIVADLSYIRTPQTDGTIDEAAAAPYQEPVDEFFRSPSPTTAAAPLYRGQTSSTADQQSVRGPADSNSDSDWTRALKPAETGSITHLWLNDGYPITGAKPTLDACRRRLDAHASGPIDIAVISNDPAMHDETDVADLYGMRDRITFDITVHQERTRAAVQEILATDHDLVHYSGHVTDDGLQCTDGWLDAATLESVATRAFILNGCRSVDQGMALVEAGAIGGLCTLSGVANTPATDIGRTVARLLNTGFSLGGALDIVTDESVTGYQYMIVGDPRLTIATCNGTTPNLVEIQPRNSGEYTVSIHGFPAASAQLGTLSMPYLGTSETYALNSGQLITKTVTTTDLRAYLDLDQLPVRLGNDLTWSNYLTTEL
jgi:hypothetical protein